MHAKQLERVLALLPSTIASSAADPGMFLSENKTRYFCERDVSGWTSLRRSPATTVSSQTFAETMASQHRPQMHQVGSVQPLIGTACASPVSLVMAAMHASPPCVDCLQSCSRRQPLLKLADVASFCSLDSWATTRHRNFSSSSDARACRLCIENGKVCAGADHCARPRC